VKLEVLMRLRGEIHVIALGLICQASLLGAVQRWVGIPVDPLLPLHSLQL
jgi:hypothetical protein